MAGSFTNRIEDIDDTEDFGSSIDLNFTNIGNKDMAFRDEMIEAALDAWIAKDMGVADFSAPLDAKERDISRPLYRHCAEAAFDAFLARLQDPDMAQISAAADKAREVGSGDFVAIWRAMLAPLKA